MSANEALKHLKELRFSSQHYTRGRDLLQDAIGTLEKEMGYELLAVLAVTGSRGEMKPLALSNQGKDLEFLKTDKTYVESKLSSSIVSITNWVAKTSQSICSGKVVDDPRYFGIRDDIQSELCVPLIVAGEVVGVINTETTIPNAYNYADQKFLEEAATLLSTIVKRYRFERFDFSGHSYLREGADLVSVCAWCNKLRTDEQKWTAIDEFPFSSAKKSLSYGICPDCKDNFMSTYENEFNSFC